MLFLSLGENCLSDNILYRYSLKSYSTPFSFSRSNIFYAYQLMKNNFKDLLSKEFIRKYQDSPFPNIYRNKEIFIEPENGLFDITSTCGFEFSHHNVVEKKSDYESYMRKINRINNLSNSESVIYFYHHRYVSSCKIEKVIDIANKIIDLNKSRKTYIIILEQIIINSSIKRHVFYKRYNNVIIFFYLTSYIWGGGEDSNIFFC